MFKNRQWISCNQKKNGAFAAINYNLYNNKQLSKINTSEWQSKNFKEVTKSESITDVQRLCGRQ